jgi:uncharacterized delta-60 repeat protein
MRFSPALVLLAMVLRPVAAAAAAGDLDPSFGDRGTVLSRFGEVIDIAYAVGRQDDGAIVVAGFSEPTEGAGYPLTVARYDASGAVDPTFGDGGVVRTPAPYYPLTRNVLIQPDQKIIVATTIITSNAMLVRYLPDGTLDDTFGSGGIVTVADGDLEIAHAALDGDKIVVALDSSRGNFDPSGDDITVLRYDADGTLDPTFGIGGVATIDFGGRRDEASGIAVDSAGRIVVSGWSWVTPTTVRNGTYVTAARLDAAGALDPGFGVGGKFEHSFGHPIGTFDTTSALLRLPSGALVIAGSANELDPVLDWAVVEQETFVLRLDDAGALDGGFGSGGLVFPGEGLYRFEDLLLAPDGKIVAIGGGETGIYGSGTGVARFDQDFVPDATFGNDGSTAAVALGFSSYASAGVVEPDGDVVVAGDFEEPCPEGDSYGLCYHFLVSRFLGAAVSCTSDGDCGACESCGAAGACVFGARSTCVASTGGARFKLATPYAKRDRHAVSLQWRGPTPLDVDPTTSDDVGLCLYLEGRRVLKTVAPAGGLCQGKPCWTGGGARGFAYKDRDLTPDGVAKIRLTAAKAQFDARGVNLVTTMHGLPHPGVVASYPSMLAQVQAGNGRCLQATFTNFEIRWQKIAPRTFAWGGLQSDGY